LHYASKPNTYIFRKISSYARVVVYERLEILLKAFRKRVLENRENDNALYTLDEFDKWWIDKRNEKWGSLVKKMSYYVQVKK